MWKFGILFFLYLVYAVQALKDRSSVQNEHKKQTEALHQPEVNQLSILARNKKIIDFDGLINNNISSARGKTLTGTKYSTHLDSSFKWRSANVKPSRFQTDLTENVDRESPPATGNVVSPLFEDYRTSDMVFQDTVPPIDKAYRHEFPVSTETQISTSSTTLSYNHWQNRRRHPSNRQNQYIVSTEKPFAPTVATTSTSAYKWRAERRHPSNRQNKYITSTEKPFVPLAATTSTSAYKWRAGRRHPSNRRNQYITSTEKPFVPLAATTSTSAYKWRAGRRHPSNRRNQYITSTEKPFVPLAATTSTSAYKWQVGSRNPSNRQNKYITSTEKPFVPLAFSTSTSAYKWQAGRRHPSNRRNEYIISSAPPAATTSTISYKRRTGRNYQANRKRIQSTTYDTIQTSSIPHNDVTTLTTGTHSLPTTTSSTPEATEKGWYHPLMWDNWSFWSPCTRTCGQGVKVRTRQCLVWDGEKFSRTHITGCHGADIIYKVCHRRKCSRQEDDYRSHQCGLLSRKPFLTTKYSKWLPSYSQDRPCYLHCRPETGSRSYIFGKVQDGTRCYKTGSSVCISGKCKKVGCDDVVESSVSPDMCGICNGKNSTCYRVSKTVLSEFPFPDSKFPDYTKIVTIPRGSRHLKILDYSRNNLALMNEVNQFVINGDRLVQDGGEYKMAGTTVKYIRSGTLGEIIMADGPITEDITLMLLYRQKNHEIKYEYWKSKINANDRNVPDASQSKTAVDLTQDSVWQKIISEERKSETKEESFLQTKWRYKNDLSTSNDVFYSVNRRTSSKLKRRPTTRPKQKLKFKKKNCPKCWKVKNRKKNFCQSDFVSRILVSSATIQNGETKYEVTVIKNYKNDGANLLNREFLWVPNICKCPRLNVGKEFIVMGNMASIHHSELRLTLTENNYVRKFKPQYEPKLHRLRRKLVCN